VNNADWTRGIGYLEFLRDIGKYLTVNYMMGKDSVRARLAGDAGISYTEFSYMLLQAFDFVHLSRAYSCRLQVGGSDQYGNITAGCELSRKMGGPQLFGLTAPLLLDSTGQKMGKTSTGERVWLDAERTSPYTFYQYWLKVADEDAPRFLRLFAARSLSDIEEIVRIHDADRSKRLAQQELARALTSWVHGAEELARVEDASRIMFGGSLEGVHESAFALLAQVVPVVDVMRTELAGGMSIVELLSRTVAESKGAARRLIQQGGAYVNNVRVTDLDHKVTLAHLATSAMLVVRGGRKDYRLVRVRG
jgi:tyrosyl-tRNA synthetase